MKKQLINPQKNKYIPQPSPSIPSVYLCLIACALGSLNVLAFAPFSYYILSWILPGALWYMVDHMHTRKPLTTACFFGIGYFATSITWIHFAVNQVAYKAWYGWIVWSLLIAALAALFVFQIGIWRCLKPRFSPLLYPILFAFIWCVNEWLRAYLLGGFPWLWIAYSQSESPLAGWLPLIGSPGLSFLVVLLSVWIVMRLVDLRGLKHLAPPFLALFLCCFLGVFSREHAWTHQMKKGINVALVQGNVSLHEKWMSQNSQGIFNQYMTLSKPFAKTDLLVWPEAALPGAWRANDLKLLQSEWHRHKANAEWITGVFFVSDQGDHTDYSNAIAAIDPKQIKIYEKRRLVPFGEYTPLSSMLSLIKQWVVFPMTDLKAGSSHQADFKIKGLVMAPFVCYEIAFPDLMIHAAKANMLLVLTDDIWFGDSLAPAQHLQIAKIRALEIGKPILFSSNNGITAIINEKGQAIHRLPFGEKRVLSAYVSGFSGLTPYTQFISRLPLLFNINK
jgi:apolipoprotein N-acyltransferase